MAFPRAVCIGTSPDAWRKRARPKYGFCLKIRSQGLLPPIDVQVFVFLSRGASREQAKFCKGWARPAMSTPGRAALGSCEGESWWSGTLRSWRRWRDAGFRANRHCGAVRVGCGQRPSGWSGSSHGGKAVTLGGDNGSKGSTALQAGVPRCRRIRSTTRGSVMMETIFISTPQVHRRGSTSRILRDWRAQEARAMTVKSEFWSLGCSACEFW